MTWTEATIEAIRLRNWLRAEECLRAAIRVGIETEGRSLRATTAPVEDIWTEGGGGGGWWLS